MLSVLPDDFPRNPGDSGVSQVLYKRKAGEEIVGQMYAFTDQEGAEVTLRPEMTPSLARMVLSLQRPQPTPFRQG